MSILEKIPNRSDYVVKEADPLNPEHKEAEYPRPFNIWIVEPPVSGDPDWRELDELATREESGFNDIITKAKEIRAGARAAVTRQAEETDILDKLYWQRISKAQVDHNKRPFLPRSMQPSDLRGELEIAYKHTTKSWSHTPELIMARLDSAASYSSMLSSRLVSFIRKEISRHIKEGGFSDKESLLQPIIAIVSDDPELRQQFMEQGANLVVQDFQMQDVVKLTQLVARIKSDPASLAPEKVLLEKRAFYKQVAGIEMGDRSEVTSDIKQELKILQEIIDKHKAKKILDVGSGTGRITNRLAENPELGLIGLEDNDSLIAQANNQAEGRENVKHVKGDLLDFTKHEQIPHGSQDAVIYTWNTILEAFGPGNLLKTLNSSWLALKQDGILVFDMPTRENPDMHDGWYANQVDKATEYLAYIPTEEELGFILRVAGFKNIAIQHWQAKPSQIYSEGMKKITVTVQKT